MGYTRGRKLTDDLYREVALKYRTRSEFQRKDPSAYSNARKSRGKEFLDDICSHMISNYSLPQLICKYITENILNETCLYNTRSIITPYEIDIYFPSFKLAFEYDGKGWHSDTDSMRRDEIKKTLLSDKGITLIKLVENHRNYEEDVKQQLVENLSLIEKISHIKLDKQRVLDIECNDVFDFLLRNNKHQIDIKIKNCQSIAEFQRKYPDTYRFLQRTKNLKSLDSLKIRKIFTDEELLKKCLEITSYKDFHQNHTWLYLRCRKRNILKEATAHMEKLQKRKVNIDIYDY